jgi:hypothetical protein
MEVAMKRFVMLCLIALVAVTGVDIASAARRVIVRRGPAGHVRSVVVVHRGWPLRRPLRTVYIRPARVAYGVAPVVFLNPVVWSPVIVSTPPRPEALVWEDGETLNSGEDWTEVTLNAGARGTKLWLEIANGKAQFDWAEVVFENGDTRVVDMKENTRGPGMYSLLDFTDGRKVDHVRLVARAKTDEARVVLRMQA